MLSLTRTSKLLGGFLLLAVYLPNSAHAALTISTTRIVYESSQRSASVVVANPSQRPFAAQAWVNTEADDTTTAVPFVTAPALFRLGAGKEQSVQISALPNELPQDRESLLFFNLQEIPQTNSDQRNALNIALRTRIKLFYRPEPVKGDPVSRLKELHLSTSQCEGRSRLNLHNPTPYYYTFSRLDLIAANQRHALPNSDMVAPLSTLSLAMPAGLKDRAAEAVVTVINDYGGTSKPLTLPVHESRCIQR